MSHAEVFPVPEAIARASHCDNAKYLAMYQRSIEDPDGFWARAGEAPRLDQVADQDQERRFQRRCADPLVRGRRAQRQRQLHRPPSGDARRSDRDPLGRRRSGLRQEDHLPRAARAGVQARQRAQGARRQEGRPGHDLHADDPRDRLRDARLRPHRRDPLGGVRRLLAGQPGRPHQRLRQQARDHHRRRPARRPQRPAQGEHRRGAEALRRRHQGADVPPHRHERADEGRARLRGRTADGPGLGRLRARADERRGPAVHPLYLGLDRQAQGRAAHDRRLPGLRRADPRVRVRLPRRRRLLVHRRRRLGHRPQLHPLRAARERRDHADVRGRAQLPGRLALLAGGRQAQGQHLLHRADRDPRADAARRRAGQEDLAQEHQAARHGRRADQPRGLALVLQRGRRAALPDRRHLVADRDRRHPDHAPAGRDRAQARLGDAAVLRRAAGDRRWRGQAARGRRARAIWCCSMPGPA